MKKGETRRIDKKRKGGGDMFKAIAVQVKTSIKKNIL